MDQHLHALAQALGLHIYGDHESQKALSIFMAITTSLPPRTCCAMGGLAVVAHVGTENRQISPDLDLLVDAKHLAQIAKAFPVKDSLLGLSVLSSTIDIDIIATRDQIMRDALHHSQIMNLGGTLLRVVTKDYLCVLKFTSGRGKDLRDLALLMSPTASQPDQDLQTKVRHILMRCSPEIVEDYDSWINAFTAGVRF